MQIIAKHWYLEIKAMERFNKTDSLKTNVSEIEFITGFIYLRTEFQASGQFIFKQKITQSFFIKQSHSSNRKTFLLVFIKGLNAFFYNAS